MAETLPNLSFEDLVLERLQLMAADMSVNAAKTPPPVELDPASYPYAYSLIGPTFEYPSSPGSLTIARTYTWRWLVAPVMDTPDTLNSGSEMYLRAVQNITNVYWYCKKHSFLSTSELDDLRYCMGIFPQSDGGELITDSGIARREKPGGGDALAVDFYLNIVMRASVSG